jgi:predicted TIM-barrel fold metal-dependent hydrolase
MKMRDGFRVIDGDGHMQEPMDIWDSYVDPAFRERAPKVVDHRSKIALIYGPCEVFPEGSKPPPRPPSFEADVPERFGEAFDTWWSLRTRIDHMDQEGVDITIGFPTNGMVATAPVIVDPALQAALCRAYNNWAIEYCHDSRGRVKFIGKITILDVSEAVREIERLADHPEVAAIVLPALDDEHLPSSPEYDPIWAAMSAAGFAACFHGGSAQGTWFRPLVQAGMLSTAHALSFPAEAMASVGLVIEGGMLERFPDLRVGFYEANCGWVPWWLSRLDDHFVGRQARYREGKTFALKPSEYFKRQCFVAADPDEGLLEATVDFFDGENILFNTDYPHADSPWPGAVKQFLDRPISDSAKQKILWDNSVKLYGDRLADVVDTVG